MSPFSSKSLSLKHLWALFRGFVSRHPSARDDILFALVWGGLTIAYVLPVLGNAFVPSQDSPCHLAVVQIWRSLDDNPVVHDHYVLRQGYQPYIVHYLLLRVLGLVMSLETANRLVLSGYALLLPLSVLYLFSRFGKDKRYALLSFPFIYNTYFDHGFLANVVALPLLFWTLAQLKTYLDKPSVHRELILAASLLLLSFTHVLVLGAFAIAAPVVLFGHVHHPLRALRRSVFVWPSVIAVGVWSLSQTGGKPIEGTWPTIKHDFDLFLGWMANIFWDGSDEFMQLVVIATVVLLVVMPADEEQQRKNRGWTLPAASLALFLSFMALPYEMRNPSHWATNVRLVVPAVLLGLATPRVRLSGWRQLALLPAVVTMFWYADTIWDKYHHYSLETANLNPVIEAVPANQRVLLLVYDEEDGVNYGGVYRHILQLYQVRKGGYLPEGFTKRIGTHSPVEQRHPSPAPSWKRPRSFTWARYGKYYDYFLVVLPRRHTKSWTTFPGAGDHVELVAKQGRFAAYKRVQD